MQPIKDLSVGTRVIDFFAVREAAIRRTKNGDAYLEVKLTDGRDNIMARMWDYNYTFCPAGNTVVKVDATVGEYRGQRQLTINRIRPAEEGEYSPRDFLPTCPEDIADLGQKMAGYAAGIGNPALAEAVMQIWSDHPEFNDAPAAMEHHHAYIGGLLHHTVNVVQKALSISEEHPEIDRDLVVAGALLHDVGKIKTYDWSGITIGMTDEGRFLGHIVLGLSLVGPYLQSLDWLTKNKLLHIIAAHHGKLEWGSPVEPAIPEAMVVFLADLADARLYKMFNARPENGNWSAYIPDLGRVWVDNK